MTPMDAKAWDERYAAPDLVWSAEPNRFVAELIGPLAPGTAVDLAAGEGRNAIWMAEQGWTVVATDYSAGGRRADAVAGSGRARRRCRPADRPRRRRHPPGAGRARRLRPRALLLPAAARRRVARALRAGRRGGAPRRARRRRRPCRPQPRSTAGAARATGPCSTTRTRWSMLDRGAAGSQVERGRDPRARRRDRRRPARGARHRRRPAPLSTSQPTPSHARAVRVDSPHAVEWALLHPSSWALPTRGRAVESAQLDSSRGLSVSGGRTSCGRPVGSRRAARRSRPTPSRRPGPGARRPPRCGRRPAAAHAPPRGPPAGRRHPVARASFSTSSTSMVPPAAVNLS